MVFSKWLEMAVQANQGTASELVARCHDDTDVPTLSLAPPVGTVGQSVVVGEWL